jgi:hypothetical protein
MEAPKIVRLSHTRNYHVRQPIGLGLGHILFSNNVEKILKCSVEHFDFKETYFNFFRKLFLNLKFYEISFANENFNIFESRFKNGRQTNQQNHRTNLLQKGRGCSLGQKSSS